MQTPTTNSRAVVIEWPSGLFQIIGRAESQPPRYIEAADEPTICYVEQRKSYYLYRPLIQETRVNV